MNIIFNEEKIYNIQDRLDVVLERTFLMEPLKDFPEGFEVLHTNDPVLEIKEDSRTVITKKLGVSNIKFMSGDKVHKNLWIYVVSATHPNATVLNGSLGPPVPDSD